MRRRPHRCARRSACDRAYQSTFARLAPDADPLWNDANRAAGERNLKIESPHPVWPSPAVLAHANPRQPPCVDLHRSLVPVEPPGSALGWHRIGNANLGAGHESPSPRDRLLATFTELVSRHYVTCEQSIATATGASGSGGIAQPHSGVSGGQDMAPHGRLSEFRVGVNDGGQDVPMLQHTATAVVGGVTGHRLGDHRGG